MPREAKPKTTRPIGATLNGSAPVVGNLAGAISEAAIALLPRKQVSSIVKTIAEFSFLSIVVSPCAVMSSAHESRRLMSFVFYPLSNS
jgi:hypothetical protein